MDIEEFISLRNNTEAYNINDQMLYFINLISGGRKININQNKNTNILKNPKLQSLKDKLENKVNLVLNKLSELNFTVLLTEFCESIGTISETDFITIQKTFYNKILADINFIKIYLSFFKVISQIYFISNNYNNKFFFDLVESKFINDYLNIEFNNEFQFLLEYNDETKRINNLVLIKNLIQMNLLNDNIKQKLNDIILIQNNYYADIYYWFQNDELTNDQKIIIKNKIINNILPLREKVLLDNLIEDKKNYKIIDDKKISDINNKIDTIEIETENILEEYLFIESINDVITFINTSCKDALTKNKFCQYSFNKYFTTTQEYSQKILELLKQLIKKQVLFKSNLSRGIILISHNWEDKSIDYSNPQLRMKEALLYLKNLGITNNLEGLLNKYQIEYYQ